MLWIVLLLVVAPLVELYVIIQVAQVIGGWETIALLIVESAIGAWLLKRQGLATLARISEALDAGRVPGKELVDGFCILVAGSLMLVAHHLLGWRQVTQLGQARPREHAADGGGRHPDAAVNARLDHLAAS